MSGHCPGCGLYHEEDDDRKRARCKAGSDRLNDRLELAERLCGLRRRWFQLTRELGASTDRSEDDRMIRELESIEAEVRSAVVDVAAMIRSDDKEITQLRARAKCLSGAARLFADVMKCRDDGPWRDVAGFRARWAIPEYQTVEAFCKQFIASAIRHAEARS